MQNVNTFCMAKGVKPTVACRDSGVGVSFLSDIKRGQTPSVAKVQLLANYLGVTTSDLLGEEIPSAPTTLPKPDFLLKLEALSPEAQQEVYDFIEFKSMQERMIRHEQG